MITRNRKPRGKCAVPNCQMVAQCGKYCHRHYNQWIYRRKEKLKPGDCPNGWPCPVCGEKLASLSIHMSKHHGIGLVEFYREHDIRCNVPGCDRLAVVRGKCKKHRALERDGKL